MGPVLSSEGEALRADMQAAGVATPQTLVLKGMARFAGLVCLSVADAAKGEGRVERSGVLLCHAIVSMWWRVCVHIRTFCFSSSHLTSVGARARVADGVQRLKISPLSGARVVEHSPNRHLMTADRGVALHCTKYGVLSVACQREAHQNPVWDGSSLNLLAIDKSQEGTQELKWVSDSGMPSIKMGKLERAVFAQGWRPLVHDHLLILCVLQVAHPALISKCNQNIEGGLVQQCLSICPHTDSPQHPDESAMNCPGSTGVDSVSTLILAAFQRRKTVQ